jgi:hypothetical protein
LYSGYLKYFIKNCFQLEFSIFQIVDNRLFSGSVDGSLKVWDISDLKEEIPKPMIKSKTTNFDRIENESNIEDRQRYAQNMV